MKVYISYGCKCDEDQHATHASSVSSGIILVSSTYTDVLAILLRLVDVPTVTSLCLLVVRFQNL